MATIGAFGLRSDVLHEHLRRRRHESIAPGTSRVFAPGVLRPTDLVTCRIPGQNLQMGVPLEKGPRHRGRVTYVGRGVVPTALQVTYEKDGSVRARCGPR